MIGPIIMITRAFEIYTRINDEALIKSYIIDCLTNSNSDYKSAVREVVDAYYPQYSDMLNKLAPLA